MISTTFCFLRASAAFFCAEYLNFPSHDLANGRIVVRRNLDEIHARLDGHLDGNDGLDRSVVEAGLIDQLDLGVADFIIGARPVFGCGGRGSVGTANG